MAKKKQRQRKATQTPVEEPSRGRGRPRKHDETTKARQLGRINEKDWQTILKAAEKAGKTKTDWIVDLCLKAAARQK